NLANEANHYNFATCLSPQFDGQVLVETHNSPNFNHLVDIEDADLERLGKSPEFPTPRIDLKTHGAILKEFLLESYELYAIKRRFIAEQEAYIHGLLDLKALEDSRNEYARKIGERFGQQLNLAATDAKLSWVALSGVTAASTSAGLSHAVA